MNTTQNRKKMVTHAVGAAVTAAAIPAPLFLGAGASHADASSHVSHVFDPGGEVALNPQPLPPDPAPDYIRYRAIFDPGAAVALNPQPLPPGGDPGSDFELH